MSILQPLQVYYLVQINKIDFFSYFRPSSFKLYLRKTSEWISLTKGESMSGRTLIFKFSIRRSHLLPLCSSKLEKKKEIDLVFPNKAHCPCMVPNSEGTNTRNRIFEYIVAWISQFLKSGKTFGLLHTAFWKSIKYFYQNITKSLQLHSSSCRKLKTRKAGFGYYTTRSGITRFNNCHTQKSQ